MCFDLIPQKKSSFTGKNCAGIEAERNVAQKGMKFLAVELKGESCWVSSVYYGVGVDEMSSLI